MWKGNQPVGGSFSEQVLTGKSQVLTWELGHDPSPGLGDKTPLQSLLLPQNGVLEVF